MKHSLSVAIKEKSVAETIEDEMTEISDSFRGSVQVEQLKKLNDMDQKKG